MNLIVWKVIPNLPIKNGKYAGQGKYTRVGFKKQDGTPGTIYLNLPEANVFPKEEEWLKYMKVGNVVDVCLQPNGKNVNYFEPFYVVDVKEKNKEN